MLGRRGCERGDVGPCDEYHPPLVTEEDEDVCECPAETLLVGAT
jgi:hypothetical protein